MNRIQLCNNISIFADSLELWSVKNDNIHSVCRATIISDYGMVKTSIIAHIIYLYILSSSLPLVPYFQLYNVIILYTQNMSQ